MAIYKPSNLDPNLQEIDLNQTPPVIPVDWSTLTPAQIEDLEAKLSKEAPWRDNIFQAQVNTSGENVVAYKMWLYDNNSDKLIWESDSISLRTTETGIFAQDGIKNKDFVKTYYDEEDNIIPYKYDIDAKQDTTQIDNFVIASPDNYTAPGNNSGLVVDFYLMQYGTYTNGWIFGNGGTFQWVIRMYTAPLGNEKQPKTKVCDGFLVGSTGYALWIGLPVNATQSQKDDFKKLNEALIYDRYIQFPKPDWYSDTGRNVFLNDKTVDRNAIGLPDAEPRKKIDWVDKEIGLNGNITKISLMEDAKYSYLDGTTFEVYLCDNKHTQTSIYADPNNQLDQALVICLCKNKSDFITSSGQFGGVLVDKILNVTNLNDPLHFTPPIGAANVIGFNRIIGVSPTTGEIRVEQPYEEIPKDGYYYVLYEYDRSENTLTLLKDQNYDNQRLGGIAVATGKVMSNRWDNTAKRLFIQPNINIKSDDTNPNEIVFTDNKVRMDIMKVLDPRGVSTGETKEDITFDKLDNTQWLLENLPPYDSYPAETRLVPFTSDGEPITLNTTFEGMGDTIRTGIYNRIVTNPYMVPIQPGTSYTVYTDFMDNSPNGLFYTRKTPEISIYFKNLNQDNIDKDYIMISSLDNGVNPNTGLHTYVSKPWRDIQFNTKWDSQEEVLIKYYYYQLYYITEVGEEQLIGNSEETYSSVLTWKFRGFQTDNVGTVPKPQKYKIKITIMDELNREFTQEEYFEILYETQESDSKFEITYDCDKQAFKIHAQSPVFAIQTKDADKQYAGVEDMEEDLDIVHVPENKVLNYTTVLAEGMPNVEFMKPFSYFTQFRLNDTFIQKIPSDGSSVITELCCYANPEEIETEEDENNNARIIATYDKYSLKITGLSTYYVDESNNQIVYNTNRLRLQWFKNDSSTPLMCFNNGTLNYYDILENNPELKTEIPSVLSYAVESSNLNNAPKNPNFPDKVAYTVSTVLPAGALSQSQVYYVLTQDYNLNGVWYKPGVYGYDVNKGWIPKNDTEFIFVDNISQLPGYTLDSFNVPLNARQNNDVGYADTYEFTLGGTVWKADNFWVDDFNSTLELTQQALATKWITSYFVINRENGVDTERAYIKMTNERII